MSRYSLAEFLALIEREGGPSDLDLDDADLAGLDAGPAALAAEVERYHAGRGKGWPCWLRRDNEGLCLRGACLERTNLSGANLEGADLREVCLEGGNLTGANLKGADLRECSLEGANVTGANFEGAEMRECNLEGANLGQANLRRANLSCADLEGAQLAQACLAAANLREADFEGANLEGVDLQGADFHGADLEGARLIQARLGAANLQGVDLEGADLSGADLSGADMRDVDLEGAHLAGSTLAGANLQGANLEGAHLAEATLDTANLRGACLSGAHADRAQFIGANLQSADLEGASLVGANLSGADLRSADLEGANLDSARLAGANLRSAHLEGARLQGAILDGADMAEAKLDDDMPGGGTKTAFGLVFNLGEDPADQTAATRTVPCEGATRLEINLDLGAVDLAAEDRADLALTWPQGMLAGVETEVSGDTVRIRQAHAERYRGWLGLRDARQSPLQIALPRAIAWLQVRTGLGSISGRGLNGHAVLSTGKGDIRCTESALEVEANAGLGGISLTHVRGRSTLHSGCGDVRLRDLDNAALTVSVGAGAADLQDGTLTGLSLRSGAGDIRCACALGPGEFQLETSAGVITLELPAEQAAQVEATSAMGQVKSDWPLVRVGRPGPVALGSTRMVGGIGPEAGRARVTLKTGVGNIFVQRRGPAAAPAAAAAAPTSATVPWPAGPAATPGAPIPVAAAPDPAANAAPASASAADMRLAILQSLARGEITVDEAEQMILSLAEGNRGE